MCIRDSLQDEYIDESDLRELAELFRDKTFLNSYAEELHKTIAPLNQSVYMAFGRVSKLEKATDLEFTVEMCIRDRELGALGAEIQ